VYPFGVMFEIEVSASGLSANQTYLVQLCDALQDCSDPSTAPKLTSSATGAAEETVMVSFADSGFQLLTGHVYQVVITDTADANDVYQTAMDLIVDPESAGSGPSNCSDCTY
jgi:hypothetical protein